MPIEIPDTRPKLTRAEALKIMRYFKIPETHAVVVGMIRGYYANKIGKPGQNDRNVYDDACLMIGLNEYQTFNGNCDPQSYRDGYGLQESTKGMASLVEGAYYMWRLDLHKGKYEAFCQRLGPCTVLRDGKPPYLQTNAYIGVNFHRGGINSTSSLACQTTPPSQYDEAIGMGKRLLEEMHGPLKVNGKYRDIVVPNFLCEAETMRKILGN